MKDCPGFHVKVELLRVEPSIEKLKIWKREHLLKSCLRRQVDRIVEVKGDIYENKLEGLRKVSEVSTLKWET